MFSWSLNVHRNSKITLLESECFQQIILVNSDVVIKKNNHGILFLTLYAAISKGWVIHLNAKVKLIEENIAFKQINRNDIEMMNWVPKINTFP